MIDETASLLLSLGAPGRHTSTSTSHRLPTTPAPLPAGLKEGSSTTNSPTTPNAKLSISFLLETSPTNTNKDTKRRGKRKAPELQTQSFHPTHSTAPAEAHSKRPRNRASTSATPFPVLHPNAPSTTLLQLYASLAALPPLLPSSSPSINSPFFPVVPSPHQPAFFFLPYPYYSHPELQSSAHLSSLQHPIPLPGFPLTDPAQQSDYDQPGTPPGLSSASSPPSSPELLSSSPSSPDATRTFSPTCSSVSSFPPQSRHSRAPAPIVRPAEGSYRLPATPNSAATQPVDVQQHTQQLLRQWHRQRQVEKLLYLQHKKQRQTQQEHRDEVGLSSPRTLPRTSPSVVPLPISSAAAGQPSSLPAETLMALVEDLLTRYVGHSATRAASKRNYNEEDCGKRRRRVPPEHLSVLEEVFAAEPFPHAEAKNVLAERLGMTKRSVTIWFQNKRARLKRSEEETLSSSSSSGSPSSSSDGIVFHQLTVDTAGHLAIIPEFPLDV